MLWRIGKAIFDFTCSYGLACVLLLLLFLLTLLGTLEQVDQGLYQVQKKYFESVFLVHDLFGTVPIPLPGAFLVMGVLFINLLCGGILWMRKGKHNVGVLIAHLGILLLMAGSFVTFKFSTYGSLALYEGEAASEYQSYAETEIAVAPVELQGGRTEHIIPAAWYADMRPGEERTFTSEALPFDVVLQHHMPNCEVVPVQTGVRPRYPVIDGFSLNPVALSREAERNTPGVYVALAEKGGGTVHEGILRDRSFFPWAVQLEDSAWTLELRRRRWNLPFEVTLEQFSRELYPGTEIPRVFRSDVLVREDGAEQKIKISMNQPLRHEGYTLFQSAWGPQDGRGGQRLYSVLAVARNPADQFPLYACIVITLGLLLHFGQRLLRYQRNQARSRT
jgi:hypothetical protein